MQEQENIIYTAYAYDENGYFDFETPFQIVDDVKLIPPNATELKPLLKDEFFYKFNEGQWIEEPKPSDINEFIGVKIKNDSANNHDIQMREILRTLQENQEGFILKNEEGFLFIEKEKPKTLQELKNEKLLELERITSSFKENVNKDMYFTSSLGFKVNGDKDALMNSKTLLDCFSLPQFGETTMYYDYNDVEHNLNKEEIQTIYVEIALYGQTLYKTRDTFVEKIRAAKNIDELNLIEFNFPHEIIR